MIEEFQLLIKEKRVNWTNTNSNWA